jgi:hypothetical protein
MNHNNNITTSIIDSILYNLKAQQQCFMRGWRFGFCFYKQSMQVQTSPPSTYNKCSTFANDKEIIPWLKTHNMNFFYIITMKLEEEWLLEVHQTQ